MQALFRRACAYFAQAKKQYEMMLQICDDATYTLSISNERSMQISNIGGNVSAYPELATAAVEGPDTTGDTLKYTFTVSVGVKG